MDSVTTHHQHYASLNQQLGIFLSKMLTWTFLIKMLDLRVEMGLISYLIFFVVTFNNYTSMAVCIQCNIKIALTWQHWTLVQQENCISIHMPFHLFEDVSVRSSCRGKQWRGLITIIIFPPFALFKVSVRLAWDSGRCVNTREVDKRSHGWMSTVHYSVYKFFW